MSCLNLYGFFFQKDDLDRIEGAKNHILKYLSDKTKLKLGMNKRTMAMGNNGKLKNTPFHNKYGEKVIEQDLQLFSQS